MVCDVGDERKCGPTGISQSPRFKILRKISSGTPATPSRVTTALCLRPRTGITATRTAAASMPLTITRDGELSCVNKVCPTVGCINSVSGRLPLFTQPGTIFFAHLRSICHQHRSFVRIIFIQNEGSRRAPPKSGALWQMSSAKASDISQMTTR